MLLTYFLMITWIFFLRYHTLKIEVLYVILCVCITNKHMTEDIYRPTSGLKLIKTNAHFSYNKTYLLSISFEHKVNNKWQRSIVLFGFWPTHRSRILVICAFIYISHIMLQAHHIIWPTFYEEPDWQRGLHCHWPR